MANYAVITGASRGIGKSTAEYFLQQQWQVINISRQECPLPSVQNFKIDLSQPDFIAGLSSLPAALQAADKICLVNNASSYHADNIYTLQSAKFLTLLQTNILAALQLNQLLLPVMKTGSAIIYIGSTLSEKAVPGAASYCIIKHAVAGMMRATCQDLKTADIHTCCICPGFTDTDMLRQHIPAAALPQITARVKAKRLITPNEIADLIYYCATHPLVNGAMIQANLGQMER